MIYLIVYILYILGYSVVICFFYFSILELPKKKYNQTQNGAELATTINWKPMTSHCHHWNVRKRLRKT